VSCGGGGGYGDVFIGVVVEVVEVEAFVVRAAVFVMMVVKSFQ